MNMKVAIQSVENVILCNASYFPILISNCDYDVTWGRFKLTSFTSDTEKVSLKSSGSRLKPTVQSAVITFYSGQCVTIQVKCFSTNKQNKPKMLFHQLISQLWTQINTHLKSFIYTFNAISTRRLSFVRLINMESYIVQVFTVTFRNIAGNQKSTVRNVLWIAVRVK